MTFATHGTTRSATSASTATPSHLRSLCIGPDPAGNLLEILYLELDDTELIIHAMPLRPVFRAYLTGDDQ